MVDEKILLWIAIVWLTGKSDNLVSNEDILETYTSASRKQMLEGSRKLTQKERKFLSIHDLIERLGDNYMRVKRRWIPITNQMKYPQGIIETGQIISMGFILEVKYKISDGTEIVYKISLYFKEKFEEVITDSETHLIKSFIMMNPMAFLSQEVNTQNIRWSGGKKNINRE